MLVHMSYSDKEKQLAYQREWMHNRRMAFFNGKVCVRCGSIDRLELDHIDPEQKISHRIWSWAQEKREAEIAKCQVLCHDCHVKKTAEDMSYGLVHGTVNGYGHHGCRCDLCTRASTDKTNEWRWKTGKRKQQRRVVQQKNEILIQS